MPKDIYIGRDAIGNYVSYGDLVVSSCESAPRRQPGRKFVTGIVKRITAKSYYNLLGDDGEVLKDSGGKPLLFPPYYTILLAHTNDIDNYRKNLVEWENDNMEGLDK